MAIKKYKATSAGRRHAALNRPELSNEGPERSLLAGRASKSAGRNSGGRITVRHHGGGHKRRYRIIDFARRKDGIPAKVVRLEYDPNRSANIALLQYADGEKAYILAPVGLGPGDVVESGADADIKPGNAIPLRRVPVGTAVHNVELKPGRGGQLSRAAGSGAQVVAKEGSRVYIRLPSGEVRLVPMDCRATIGRVGNVEHENQIGGKAGRSRHRGKRPTVRGTAMNAADHPHGGGEGRSPIGRHQVNPSGNQTKGQKTRKRKKYSNKYIVRDRRQKRR